MTESDQRRALMMPQELIQMPTDRLIVLRAGMPPVRGRKIAYWRERAFAKRVAPPPQIPVRAVVPDPPPEAPVDPLTLQLGPLAIAEVERLAPLPPMGASAEAVEAWVDRYVDAMDQPPSGAVAGPRTSRDPPSMTARSRLEEADRAQGV
jgi:type IV secretion system protein VirD4